MSIITKRGDDGGTDLLFGRRIRKSSLRVRALGAVDELNAALGLARAAGLREDIEPIVDLVQEKLVAAMGQLATLPEDRERYTYAAIGAADVAWLEQVAQDMESRGVRFTDWARPGAEGAIASAALDMARTVARRAESQAWDLHDQGGEVCADVLLFLNRVSDLMWILARASV
ncbi:MAG: hypothetical protein RI957_1647 [Verrucomicrobiota bacterium]|jgi:cob(I)alamin adenosyltransferase